MTTILPILLLATLFSQSVAFTFTFTSTSPVSVGTFTTRSRSTIRATRIFSSTDDGDDDDDDDDDGSMDDEEDHPLADVDDERKSNLFSMMLRDLQIEGVPLLGCDADQVHTLQAALWTTMSELSEQDDAQKACLIMENIPTAALQTFVDDFLVLKTQSDQMEYLPELERVSASIVGKGLGPAVLLEVTPKTATAADDDATTIVDEFKCSAAMKSFMNRVVIGNDDADDESAPASIGLGDEGSAAPIDYRFSSSANICATIASFWNCVCEMQSDASIGTLCLQLPSISNNRFATVSQLLSRSLCLYQGDSVFSLVHFSPTYDRNQIEPVDRPAFGHLPPMSWLTPMLVANGDDDSLLDDDDAALAKSNYQRKSPICAVNIVRNSLLADPTIVAIELQADGRSAQASGLEVYCPNAIRLAATDEAVWKGALAAELAILE
eukprot:CAMPEP_0119008190 /NCGR_PEP_ID=MMETSP1176-20130426/3525_1 /TAXON_ID=265551 /ORGANISM="Synedropsis recta cf, Strain CCMP1620" /LENGTH=437 /DNA_ID=CAMNT_0006960477 /DNA_START=20 /DNA_END=1333 /DNA_ORIENTATION=-